MQSILFFDTKKYMNMITSWFFFYFTEINPLMLCNDMAYDYMKNIM